MSPRRHIFRTNTGDIIHARISEPRNPSWSMGTIFQIHGYDGTFEGKYLEAVARRLARDYTIIAPTLRGSGPQSEIPLHHLTWSSGQEQFECVYDNAVTQGIGPAGPTGIQGHSYGAAIATIFAADHPEVAALALGAMVPYPARAFRFLYYFRSIGVTAAQLRLHSNVRDGVLEFKWGEHRYHISPEFEKESRELDLKSAAAKVHARVMMVSGENDKFSGKKALCEIKEAFPLDARARLVMLPGIGHRFDREANRRLGHVVSEFFRNTLSPAAAAERPLLQTG